MRERERIAWRINSQYDEIFPVSVETGTKEHMGGRNVCLCEYDEITVNYGDILDDVLVLNKATA